MNVLMISLDSTLLKDRETAVEDSQDRHILYGKYVSQLFIVVRAGRGNKPRRLSDNVTVYPAAFGSLWFVWDAYQITKRIVRQSKIDVITAQDPLLTGMAGYLIKRRYNIPLNVQLHGNYLNNIVWLKQAKINHLLNMVGNYIVKKADSVRVVAKNIGERVALKLNIPAEKFITLPVPTDIGGFINSSSNKRLEEEIAEFENVVLFVGRLSKEKNVEALLVAAKDVLLRYPRVLFIVVGDGPMREDLQELARRLRIEENTKFEGLVSYKEIPGYYHLCDVLVLPSKHEGWGRVVVEGLACGKAVIVSDVCGVAEFVTEQELGFTFPPDSQHILADRIIQLLGNPEMREEMGARGREYVRETMGIEKRAPEFADLYQKTVELSKK
ncbi:MAG TPA: glycosyltransferase family 4 protein [Dehalococcoidia bacterium]|nr:glycosyltransferase family 4 protein [Dehalococcoidia bacterium]